MEEHFGLVSEDKGENEKTLSKHSKKDHIQGTKFSQPSDYKKKLELMREKKKKKQERKKRLIIRNLSFKIDEDELKKIFSKYGKIGDLIIPKKPDGKKRGFAFVQYVEFWSTIQAIKNLNYQELHGRPIAIDYAVSKDKYDHMNSSKVVSKPAAVEKTDVEVESESDSDQSMQDEDAEEANDETSSEADPEEGKVKQFLKEFDEGRESEIKKVVPENVDSSSEDEEAEHDDDNEEDDDDEQGKSSETKNYKPSAEKRSSDVNEGKTVFVRNICFETDEGVFKQTMEEFGPVKYCLLCIDPLTDHPKGTAFVKFENKEDAEKLITKTSDDNSEGIFLDGRRLYSSLAVSREDLQKKIEDNKKKGKDKRNLALLKEGQVPKNSYEAEGVSESDLAKRLKLEMLKKKKLKNLHFFVSDTRLCVHNIPPTLNDAGLRLLFKKAVGPEAKIIEARIMKNLQKLSPTGVAESKGFGFVAFSRHEDALQALKKINNNPEIFSAQKRPIVEFSIENRTALITKQRRKERSRMKIKKKAEQSEAIESTEEEPYMKHPTNRNKGRNNQKNNKQWQIQRGKNSQNNENTRESQLDKTKGPNRMNKQWQNRRGNKFQNNENARESQLEPNRMNQQWQNQRGKNSQNNAKTRESQFGKAKGPIQMNKKRKRFDKEKKQNKKKRRKNGDVSQDKMDGGQFSKLVNSYKEKLTSKME